MNLTNILNPSAGTAKTKGQVQGTVDNGFGASQNLVGGQAEQNGEFLDLLNNSMQESTAGQEKLKLALDNQLAQMQNKPMASSMQEQLAGLQVEGEGLNQAQPQLINQQAGKPGIILPQANAKISQLGIHGQAEASPNMLTGLEDTLPNEVPAIANHKSGKHQNLHDIIQHKKTPVMQTRVNPQQLSQSSQVLGQEAGAIKSANQLGQFDPVLSQAGPQVSSQMEQARPMMDQINLKNALSQKNHALNSSKNYFGIDSVKKPMVHAESAYQHKSIFLKRPAVDENGQMIQEDSMDQILNAKNDQAMIEKNLSSLNGENVKMMPVDSLMNKTSQTESTQRVLDFQNINLDTSTDKIIDQISSYIVRNKVEANPTMQVRVNHDELGMIDIKIEKFHDNLNIKIGAENINGKLFFDQNSNNLMEHLRTSGIKLGEFNIDWSRNSDKEFSQSGRDFSQNFGGNSRQQSGQGFHSRQEDSQRRQELWNQYLDQREAA